MNDDFKLNSKVNQVSWNNTLNSKIVCFYVIRGRDLIGRASEFHFSSEEFACDMNFMTHFFLCSLLLSHHSRHVREASLPQLPHLRSRLPRRRSKDVEGL